MPKSECSGWDHWDSIQLESFPDIVKMIRGFFPVYRISRRALEYLDACYLLGSAGHMEGLMPTLLYNGGFQIEDIGGEGPFVAEGCTNRFYTNCPTTTRLSPGTLVYRPVLRQAGKAPNKLWHPVKPVEHLARRVLNRAVRHTFRFFRSARDSI